MAESIFKKFQIPEVEELLNNKAFMNNFLAATKQLHLKSNTLSILSVYANLAILNELKEIKILLDGEESKKRILKKTKE